MEDVFRDYGDIIDTEYPFALSRPRMGMTERAAQFSSYKALSGFEEEISETARTTEERADLDESAAELIDRELRLVKEKLDCREQPLVKLTYFVPDGRKAGGRYVTLTDKVTAVDEFSAVIRMSSGAAVPIRELFGIELRQPDENDD